MSALDPDCTHIPTSPGQSVCRCLDTIMDLRLGLEILCRRVVELETAAQTHAPRIITVGKAEEVAGETVDVSDSMDVHS